MGTYVVTGAASGIGAATRARLLADGHDVIGIDLKGSDIDADLSSSSGCTAAVDAVLAAENSLAGVVTCAGVAGLPGRDGGRLVALNFFGTVRVLSGLRAALANGVDSAVVAIASNSVTTVPLVSEELVVACLDDDEESATVLGSEVGAVAAYPSSKAAICRWVRLNAPGSDWIGDGITLNAVAPGVTETPMIVETRADPVVGGHFANFPIPVGRPAEPSEIAGVVNFLLSPDARFICGSVLFADGGTDALLNTRRF